MQDTFIVDTLKSYFSMEISNKLVFGDNEIIVELADGTKARITTKNVA